MHSLVGRLLAPLALTATLLPACAPVRDCPPHNLLDCDEVVIQVLGARDAIRVELAGQALALDSLGGSGIGEITAPDGGEVRVYHVETCILLAAFPAQPNTIHRIRFDDAGRPLVSQVDPREPVELGPGIETVEPSDCGR